MDIHFPRCHYWTTILLLSLFFLNESTVSPTSTPCSNCDGNNVTCVDGVCLPRCVNVECLQCLDSRFYGKQCEHDCPNTCLSSRCQMNNSRVVCSEGCVAGKKGDNCGVNCPTACTQCKRYGDGCTGPCQDPRYYGPHCRTPCSSNCTVGCNRITGECGSCEPGYMGDKCNVTCSSYCRGRCDKDTGKCGSCVSGYMGDKCNVTCPPNCRGRCDKDTGKCDSCVSGYMGDKCNVTCPPNCKGRCDKDTGKCDSCVSGYIGDKCNVTCPPNCKGRCDKDTGECGSCVSGYMGDKCNVTCPPNCKGRCDKDTGECGSCVSGYMGDKCDVTCPPNCKGRCDKDTGECGSCEPGHRGKYCDDSCPTQCSECQQHGVNCIGQCHGNNCTLQCPVQCRGCVKETGSCVQCAEQHCRAGCGDQCTPCKGEDCHSQTCKMICPANCVEFNYFSKTCNTPCINKNYFGQACNIPCFGKCDTCDKDTGKCISCKLGLRGELCDDTCPSNCTQCERYGDICIGACPNSGYYGRDCSIQCPVSCEGCHKETGLCIECALGFSRTYCDEICSPCSENTCYRTPCRKRKTDHTVAITTGTVAVVIVLALIIAFWRHTHAQKGNRIHVSGTNGTTHTEYSDSLAHRYWEIGDHYESGQTSPPQPEHAVQPALPLTDILHRRLATRNLLADGQRCQRKSSSLSETRAVSEPELTAPDAAVGDGVVRASSLLLLRGASAGSENESQYQSRQEVGDADMVMSEQIERLTRKTASIIFIEENCDLSNVCVKYLATNKVEHKSSP